MAIVKMKKLRLLAARSQTDELLQELMLLGCVEVTDPEKKLEDEEIAALVTRESSALSKYRTEHAELLTGLNLLTKYAPVKSKMLAPKPEVRESEFLDETELEDMIELSRRLENMDDQARRAIADESRFRSQIEALKPWETLDIPVEYSGTARVAVFTGVVPSACSLDELKEETYSVSEEVEIICLNSDREQHYLLVFCLRDAQSDVLITLRKFDYTTSPLSGYAGSVKENIQALEQKLVALAKEKDELAAKIAAEGGHRESIKLCADRMQTKIAKAEVNERLLTTGNAIYFDGWFPIHTEGQLSELLSKYDCAWEVEDPAEDDVPDVPIMLKNNAITEPLMVVTEMYSLPAYDGIDPNPLMMPFFTAFFGIMFADMGYGIILFLGTHVVLRKMKPKAGTMKYLLSLIRMCGVTTFIMGFLTGGFFGDAVPILANMFGYEFDLWRLFSPLENPIQVLIGSMVLGAVHLITGQAISVYMNIRDGKPLDALKDTGSTWLMLIGLGVGVVTGNWYVAIAGLIAMTIAGGPGKLYNDITGLFGDILSYSRLMTLMLASGVIASVFNQIAAMPGNIIVFIPIFLVGHSLNIGLNIIGTFVHTMRLQYLEYFGKFYKDGGKAFRPLKVSTKFVDIIKEEK